MLEMLGCFTYDIAENYIQCLIVISHEVFWTCFLTIVQCSEVQVTEQITFKCLPL